MPSAPPAGQSLPASSTSQDLPSGQGPPSVKGPPSTPAGAQGPPSVPSSGHQGPPAQGSSYPPQVKSSEHLITKTNLVLQVGGPTLAPNHTARAAPVGHRPPPPSTSTSSSPASGTEQLRYDFDPRLPPAGVPPAGSSSSPYPAPSFAHSAPPHGSSPASSSGSVGAAGAPGPAGLRDVSYLVSRSSSAMLDNDTCPWPVLAQYHNIAVRGSLTAAVTVVHSTVCTMTVDHCTVQWGWLL